MFCIAKGYPCVYPEWVEVSIQQQVLQDESAYAVHAGKSFVGDMMEQQVGVPRTPLVAHKVSSTPLPPCLVFSSLIKVSSTPLPPRLNESNPFIESVRQPFRANPQPIYV